MVNFALQTIPLLSQRLAMDEAPVDLFDVEPIDFDGIFGEAVLLFESPPCAYFARPLTREQRNG